MAVVAFHHPPAHRALSRSAIISLSYTSTNVSILSEILLIGSLVIALLLPALFEFFHLLSNNQYLLARHQSRAPKPKVRTLFQSRTLARLTSDLHCLQSFFSKKQSFRRVFSTVSPLSCSSSTPKTISIAYQSNQC
jgi:hypothetical protein